MSGPAGLREVHELVVVGAGPAGLAAATTAAALGVDTVLLDEQPAAGGRTGGPERAHGAALTGRMRAAGALHVPGATVWSLGREREIGVSVAGSARLLRARRVILAGGALERPFPAPGWTLPGVMTAGAALILLTASGLVAREKVVLAGTGPLLWLSAARHLRAGGRIAALLDTTPRENRRRALPHLAAFLASPDLRRVLSITWQVRRQVRVVRHVTALRAEGDDALRAVAFRTGAAEQVLPAGLLLLHQGLVPNTDLSVAAGCAHDWDPARLCFAPQVDAWGASSLEGVAIAGDGASAMGAPAAEAHGTLAGLDAALRLGRIDRARRDAEAEAPRAALARARRGHAFLDALHRPAPGFRIPQGETLVCRCEEVTARQVAEAVALGCTGPNQMKSFLRCGMGPCQGRQCGLTVTESIAMLRGVSPAEVGHFRLRPPVKPIPLAELASLHAAADMPAMRA